MRHPRHRGTGVNGLRQMSHRRSVRTVLALSLLAVCAIGAPGGQARSAATSYDQTVLANAPAAYWRLGETSGTAAVDTSGKGNGGSYSGGVALALAGLINDPNTAATLRRQRRPDVLQRLGQPEPDGGDQRRGVGSTHRRADGRRLRLVVLEGELATGSPRQSGAVRAQVRLHSLPQRHVYGVMRYRPPLAAGTTYHVVGTYDGASLRIYVNGGLQGTRRAQRRGQRLELRRRPRRRGLGNPAQPGIQRPPRRDRHLPVRPVRLDRATALHGRHDGGVHSELVDHKWLDSCWASQLGGDAEPVSQQGRVLHRRCAEVDREHCALRLQRRRYATRHENALGREPPAQSRRDSDGRHEGRGRARP